MSPTRPRWPSSVELSPTGVLSGTPTRAGSSSVTIRSSTAVSSQQRSFVLRIR